MMVNLADDTENSMISFWSGSGNESYFNTPSKPPPKNNTIESDSLSNLSKEELMERYQSLLESVEVYKLATNVLMKENQELKLKVLLLENDVEIEENEAKDFTD